MYVHVRTHTLAHAHKHMKSQGEVVDVLVHPEVPKDAKSYFEDIYKIYTHAHTYTHTHTHTHTHEHTHIHTYTHTHSAGTE